jgi:hypothetical protein
MSKFTWDELCVLEAANRGLRKAYRAKHFDSVVFEAVAKIELERLRLKVKGLTDK